MKLILLDSTLREGRQSLFFDVILKIQPEYLKIISSMGIRHVEYRNPFVSQAELNTFRKSQADFPRLTFHVHFYLSKENIDLIWNDPSITDVSTFIPFPPRPNSVNALAYMSGLKGKNVRISIENSSMIPFEKLQELLALINRNPSVTRIGFSDTLGRFTPDTVRDFVENIRTYNLNGKAVEFHLHNDFGLAASNAYQILSSAQKLPWTVYLSATVSGIGDRNGILSFGDFISSVINLNIEHDLNLEYYGDLLRLIRDNGIEFNRDPLCENSFRHFASSHILSEMDYGSYENVDPAILGLKQNLFFNRLTSPEVYLKLANKILKQRPINPLTIRDYVLSTLDADGKQYLLIDEVIDLIKKYASQ